MGLASALLLLSALAVVSPQKFRILGLFDESLKGEPVVVAFKYSIFRVNQMKLLGNVALNYDVRFVQSSSAAAQTVLCEELSKGVVAVFARVSGEVAPHIRSVCAWMAVPLIEARWDLDGEHPYVLNLHPDTSYYGDAFIDLARHFRFASAALIYDREEALVRMSSVLRTPSMAGSSIVAFQFHPGKAREILKDVVQRKVAKIFVDLNEKSIRHLLKAALQLGMISNSYHLIFSYLDMEAIDMEDYKYNGVRLMAFGILSREHSYASSVVSDMLFQSTSGFPGLTVNGSLRVDVALVYDAVVHVVSKNLQMLLERNLSVVAEKVSCEKETPWSHGSMFYRYLESTRGQGLTGNIEFEKGTRKVFDLNIIQLAEDGFHQVGSWSRYRGLNFTERAYKGEESHLSNKTLVVTSILSAPFVMTKHDKKEGTERYEGFCIDLLREIASMVGFRYQIKLVNDGQFGAPNDQSGEWTGMVRELVDRKADLAVAPLTISYIREQVIDFTKPFMNVGISILFKEPKGEKAGLFSFMNPLSTEIWLYTISAYFLVTVILFVLARFSPYEWYNPHPCQTQSDFVQNQFSVLNCLWFSAATLMQQGCDVSPRAVSTRIVGGFWWFFTFIIISSYTANLAAFLTVEKVVLPVENAEDLSKQNQISYGTIYGGSTMIFFKTSKIPTYQRMWSFMRNKRPSVFVANTEQGIERVMEGNYAFFMESTMLDYVVQRNCNLTPIGGLLDTKDYGIGTPIGSPYRDLISMAILELQEKGRIQMLYNKWWKNTGSCHKDNKDSKTARALGIANVGGIFVVLFAGLAAAIVAAFVEFVWKSRKNSLIDKRSLCEEMSEELRFAVRCTTSSKRPAVRRRHCRECDSRILELFDEEPRNGSLPLAGGTDLWSDFTR